VNLLGLDDVAGDQGAVEEAAYGAA